MGITVLTEIGDDEQRLAKAMAALASEVPTNELGFPIGYYRGDLLPFHDYIPEEDALQKLFSVATETEGGDPYADEGEGHERKGEEASETLALSRGFTIDLLPDDPEAAVEAIQEDAEEEFNPPAVPAPQRSDRVAGFRRRDLSVAFVLLAYDEGFPTQPDGRPFWERFEHEPVEAHMCFQAYLQMPNVADGIRSLDGLPLVMETNKLLNTEGLDYAAFTQKFRTWYQIYCWGSRTKAYDFYKIAAMRKAMEHRANSVQDNQFRLATRLMDKLTEYMDTNEEFWDMMTPKVAIDMLKSVSVMQRVNAGLPGAAPPTERTSNVNQGQSFEMILRTLAQKSSSNLPGGTGNEIGRSGSGGPDSQIASRILDSPEATQLAQELILRMTSHNG